MSFFAGALLFADFLRCRENIWVPWSSLGSLSGPLILWARLWPGLSCTNTLNSVAAGLFSDEATDNRSFFIFESLLTYASWKKLCSSFLWWRSGCTEEWIAWGFKPICLALTVEKDDKTHDSMRATHIDNKPNFILSFPKSKIVIRISKEDAWLNNRPPRVFSKNWIDHNEREKRQGQSFCTMQFI